MPRKPRLFVPGVPQHVVQRGNNRQQTFFDESDFRLYLDCLRLAGEEFGVSVHAYVLMTNHVHLLVTPDSSEALSRTMQAVGRQYVLKINRKYRRSGTLWEGRFKAGLVGSERYLLTCYRYIELNPHGKGVRTLF
jgi:putative transposase